MNFSKHILGSYWELLIVARIWAGGTRETLSILAAHFAKRNTKFGGGGKIGTGKRGRAT